MGFFIAGENRYLNLRWFFCILVFFEFGHFIGCATAKTCHDIFWFQFLVIENNGGYPFVKVNNAFLDAVNFLDNGANFASAGVTALHAIYFEKNCIIFRNKNG